MRLLLLLLILGGAISLPFAMIKRPWAVKLWQRVRLFMVVYIIVILVSAIVRLVLRWDQIYG